MNMTKALQKVKPAFLVYPKRKSLADKEASVYLRISYQFVTIDKSTGIKIPVELWDSQSHSIRNSPVHQNLLTETVDEMKQKLMGAFYLLTNNNAEPTLREIVDFAFAEEGKKTYSLFGVFGSELLKMEKRNKLPRQQSNILKHYTCMKHLKAFVKSHLNVNDVAFNRINRNFIDEFEEYLKSATGKNAQTHIQESIVERAKELLSTTDLSIKEIAYGLGFEYPQSFSTMLKKNTQQTPLQFRASFN